MKHHLLNEQSVPLSKVMTLCSDTGMLFYEDYSLARIELNMKHNMVLLLQQRLSSIEHLPDKCSNILLS